MCFAKSLGYTWEAVGCYNSQTPAKRNRYAQLVSRQLERIQRDERQPKTGVEAAVRSKVNAQAKAGLGSEQNLERQPGVPLAPDAAPEQPALPSGAKSVPSDVRGTELSASSVFEASPTGM